MVAGVGNAPNVEIIREVMSLLTLTSSLTRNLNHLHSHEKQMPKEENSNLITSGPPLKIINQPTSSIYFKGSLAPTTQKSKIKEQMQEIYTFISYR